MRELRNLEGEATVVIPIVVRSTVIRVQLATIVVAVGIEHVEIVIGNARCLIFSTTPRIL